MEILPPGVETCCVDKEGCQFNNEKNSLNEAFKAVRNIGQEGRLRVITYIWDYFQLDDFKREKQLAIQKQVKEASK